MRNIVSYKESMKGENLRFRDKFRKEKASVGCAKFKEYCWTYGIGILPAVFVISK